MWLNNSGWHGIPSRLKLERTNSPGAAVLGKVLGRTRGWWPCVVVCCHLPTFRSGRNLTRSIGWQMPSCWPTSWRAKLCTKDVTSEWTGTSPSPMGPYVATQLNQEIGNGKYCCHTDGSREDSTLTCSRPRPSWTSPASWPVIQRTMDYAPSCWLTTLCPYQCRPKAAHRHALSMLPFVDLPGYYSQQTCDFTWHG